MKTTLLLLAILLSGGLFLTHAADDAAGASHTATAPARTIATPVAD